METLHISQVEENVYALNEVGKTVMYLIIGQQRALLLDTGFGLRPLAPVLREKIGEKPVVQILECGFSGETGRRLLQQTPGRRPARRPILAGIPGHQIAGGKRFAGKRRFGVHIPSAQQTNPRADVLSVPAPGFLKLTLIADKFCNCPFHYPPPIDEFLRQNP